MGESRPVRHPSLILESHAYRVHGKLAEGISHDLMVWQYDACVREAFQTGLTL